MSPDLVPPNEAAVEHVFVNLTELDQAWLSSFGVEASWATNARLVAELNEMVLVGSLNINEGDNEANYQQIVLARESFFEFIGIEESALAEFRQLKPTLIPIGTFIGVQRTLQSYDINGADVINRLPRAMSFAAISVEERLKNLGELGLNPAEVINSFAQGIRFAPETIKSKLGGLAELGLNSVPIVSRYPGILSYKTETIGKTMGLLSELGLDAIRVVNSQPHIFNFSHETIKAKINNLVSLGLDASKVVNAYPTALISAVDSVQQKMTRFDELGLNAVSMVNKTPAVLGLASETVKTKMDNLTMLGLDASKVVNGMPPVLNLSLENIEKKIRLITRSVELLGWDYRPNELIEMYPPILCFNIQKLRILRRIAAENLNNSAPRLNPKTVRAMLITPLESYLLALDQMEDTEIQASELRLQAGRVRLPAAERRASALALAKTGRLGRVGTMYLQYRGLDNATS